MNKLEEQVASLNLHEVKAFKNYLQSPYFTGNKKLLQAFESAHKEIESSGSLNKATVFKKVNAAKRFHNKSWRYMQSELSKHLEYFFVLRTLDKNNQEYNSLLLKSLSEKDCEKSWHFVHNEMLHDNKNQNADYFLKQFEAAENSLNYLATKQSRKKKFDYEAVFKNLDTFFLSKKLQLFSEVTNLKNILKGEFDLHLFNELKTLAANPQFKSVPVIQIYYNILLTLTEPEKEKYFEKLRTLVSENAELFSAKELSEFYVYIKNYCIKKINRGNAEFVKSLFEINKQVLSNKKLMCHEWLSQFEFKNIVSIALRLSEKDWCKKFIKKYISFLKPEERKNALTYNMAYWYFMTGNFKEAIRKLIEVEFTDVVYQIDSRVILLKCYYELDDVDAFFYHASAFRLFLLRNRYISDYQKTFNRNLIKFLSALWRAGTSPAKLKRLMSAIEKEKNVADLKWLMEKVEIMMS